MMRDKIIPIIFVLMVIASCSDVKDVSPSDWKRYDWMREILGEQVVADSATHNIDTGEYRFTFTTTVQSDSAISMFDKRAIRSGWEVKKRDSLSRIYIRRKDTSNQVGGYGCISIQSQQGGDKFEFLYRPMFDC